MIRRPKELLRLPEKRINYIPLVMEPAQRRLYDAAKNKIKSELVGTKVYGASKLALLTRLRQITTAPILVDSDVVGIKELVLEELLEEIRDSGEKAVVFSIYAQFTRYLRDKFQKFNPAYIDGTLNSRKAQEQVDKLEDPNVSMIIASLFAGNESYTMTAARHAIFTDMSWTVTDNQQAEDRIHRRGQTESVSINYLYCKDSIDERVLDILEEDASLIYEVVEGSERRLSKEVFEHLLS
jgi:SNF2 family DNA or RNA helicase